MAVFLFNNNTITDMHFYLKGVLTKFDNRLAFGTQTNYEVKLPSSKTLLEPVKNHSGHPAHEDIRCGSL